MPEPLTETPALMPDQRVCAAWPDCCAWLPGRRVRAGRLDQAASQAAARPPKDGDRATALRLAR